MPVQSDVSSTTTAHRDRRRSILLAGVSAAALFLSASEAIARPLGGSAPTASAAAVAAAQSAAEEAARAAMAANDSLRRATLAIQAQQAVQQAARNAAQAAQQANLVPNGLRPGGLQIGGGVIGPNGSVNQNLWKGADLPTERADGDRVNVDIRQREQKAILSWDSFNVGARTDLRFDQQGNRNWIALNRVLGVDARPSQILGSIKADGSVYVINQNGIIFGGTSQINVGALVASTAKISNEQFLNNGIYSRYENGTYYPSFTDAGGQVKVEPGALIETKPPAKNTTGGGFVLLLGTAVENAGRISSPQGQVILGAGDDFLLRPGYGTSANQTSTTRGHEIAPLLRADSLSGAVTNSGLIYSQQGDITLAGRAIVQDGALVSTTSVNTRGTIHLLNAVSDTDGSVTLGANSLTTILPELDSDATALNSQRDAFIAAVRPVGYDPQFDNLSKLPDRLDQSRIEIVTGGDVVFTGGSITQAQGGQVAVFAIGRVFTGSGATIDVSGTRGVLLPMAANNIEVNIQGNELRDSPANRDQNYLKNADVWIDLRDLVLVPAGTGGYASDRYYTPGGLLEVSGYLSNTAHKIGEWTAVGGTITLSARDVVAQPGSIFNISGGSVTYEGGYIKTSNFVGADGRTYNINNARADMLFTAVGGSFVRKHYIQGQVDDGLTEIWASPFGKGRVSQRWEDGYTVGRDAGQLILSTPTSIFEGTILADVVKGERQTGKRPSGVTDGYKLGQNTVAQAGKLALGDYGKPGQTPGAPLGFVTDVKFDDHVPALANTLSPTASVPEDRANTAWFDTNQLNSFGLGGLTVTTGGHVAIDAPLTLAPGGQMTAAAPVIDVNSTVTVHSGNVSFSNVVDVGSGTLPTIDGMLGVWLHPGAVIDTRGLWTNGLLDRGNLSGLAFVDGGNVSLSSPQSVTLSAGSLIDASSGGAVLVNGKITGGKGGDITLIADMLYAGDRPGDPLVLEGTVRSYGMTKGGTLTISSGSAINISNLPLLADGLLPAGQATTTDLFLDSVLVIPAGTQIPFTYNMTVTKALPGEALQMDLMPDFSRGVTLSANWQVPDGLAFVYDSNFTYYYPGTPVPAGTQLLGGGGVLTAGYVLPADAFPNGLAVAPATVTYAAGSTAPKELSVPVGTRIPTGTVLAETVAIKPLLNLDPGIFKSGFSNYDISSGVGVVVGKNVQVDVTMPVYRTTAASYAVPTGSDPATALEVWTPPLYQENASTAQLTQRAGASLKLTTDPNAASGSGILIDTGAALRVDPGQSVSIASTGQTTVDGMISAPGGAITIDLILQSQTGIPGQSIWIGDNAVLDVAGRAVTAVDRQGRPYGVVSDGGSIAIGVRFDSSAQVDTNGFVVVRPGAVLDASGASAVIAPYGTVGGALTAVASNGGSIALASRHGIFLDGTVRAAAGGAGASGGTLSLLLGENLAGADWDPSDVQLVPRRLIITQDYVPSGMRADLKPGEADPTLGYGVARISAKQIEAGGFDSLSLRSSTAFVFDGPVSLNLGRSIVFDRGVLTSSDTASSVALTAPYVLLRGYAFTTGQVGSSFSISSPSSQATTAKLTVSADLIDVQNYVQFGASGKIESNGGAQVSYDMAGFRDIDLTSRGDIRFVRNSGQTTTFPSGTRTTLRTPGNLTLTAGQLYPTTGAQAEVYAAFDPSLPDARLSIKRIDDELPQTPFSAFGSLSLYASVIDQGGVIRAPLGDIVLGADSNSLGTIGTTGAVNLLPGSITSVSAAGLLLPFGGTTDGVSYKYNGSEFSYGVVNTPVGGSITFSAQSVVGHQGATLDLSGGGKLAGAAFISGRGGSVDILTTALANANPANSFSASGNAVYAIMPGYASSYAPSDPSARAAPATGQQITIPAGVPGLPAGTYILLPSQYALLPGAFRVELGGTSKTPLSGAIKTESGSYGSYLVDANTGIANTSIQSSLPIRAIITPVSTVRKYAQYNEISYSDFAIQKAATLSQTRPALPADAKTLNLLLAAGASEALTFAGTALFQPAEGGIGGTATVDVTSADGTRPPLEIFGAAPTPGFEGVSVRASELNALNAGRLWIGGGRSLVGGSSTIVNFRGSTEIINVRADAYLRAPEIFLMAADYNPYDDIDGGRIDIAAGARIETIRMGKPPFDSSDGLLYSGLGTMVAVSNGWLNFLPPASGGTGGITIGACPSGSCTSDARIVSDGTITFLTPGEVKFGTNFRLGAKYLSLAVPTINIGETAALADANVPTGFLLNQSVLNMLLAGDPGLGAPKLERLTLGAANSINFLGTVSLNTIDPATGKSSLDQLVLNTPAIYGYGDAGDVATITTETLYWNGVIGNVVGPADQYGSAPPGAVVQNGPGTGSGALNINAERIVFGYSDTERQRKDTTLDRLALGFSTVNLAASDRITANGKGSLSVFQAQGDYVEGKGYVYSGGALNLITPLLTGEAGSVTTITAGGALTMRAPAGAAVVTPDALGAEIRLNAASITQFNTTIGLPSGRLTMNATGDIVLASGSKLDLAGRAVQLIDQTRYSWGGDVILTSTEGNVVQQAGSTIDISAANNDAGTVTVDALGAEAGRVDLAGLIKGDSSGGHDAGGSAIVPYDQGGISIRAQTLADFDGLNRRLTESGVIGARSFVLKQGDLTIGNEVKAREVTISVDGGSLTVVGRIDASGAEVGTIRLSARDNLTLASGSMLDAHGTVLRVDSYSQPIEASNRAVVELTTKQGTLDLAAGATIDVRSADTVARGGIILNAPRRGGVNDTGDGANDIAISAAGPLDIRGAQSVALNGFRSYDDAPFDPNPTASGRPNQIITQEYLDGIDADSTAFIDVAALNGALQSKIAGLKAYGNSFHLRPGVEIRSATDDGDLTVQGDIDLAGYRYGSNADRNPMSPTYGAGEPGSIVIRAGDDLSIYGSVTDGFGKPVATPDGDNGWYLTRPGYRGTDANSADLKLPVSVTIAADTILGGVKSVNFAIPLGNMTVAANAVIPTEVTLAGFVTIPPGGVVARASIRLPDGQTFAKGQVIPGGTELPFGTTLGAGSLLPVDVPIQALLWPAGAPFVFSTAIKVMQDTTIPAGSILPGLLQISEGGFVTIDPSGERVVNPYVPLRAPGADGSQGKVWGSAPMLSAGSLSWSMRLAAGADLKSADTRTLKPGRGGDINLADTHYSATIGPSLVILPDNPLGIPPNDPDYPPSFWCNYDPTICGPGPVTLNIGSALFSVLRTGTGDLDLLAGGNYTQYSLYGVYTAGTQAAAIDPKYQLPRGADGTTLPDGAFYQAYYPDHGGNVLLSAGGNVSGLSFGNSNAVGNWLWRQGGAIASQATAWWINFGLYTNGVNPNDGSQALGTLTGFSGLGALGGGNVTVSAGGDIGALTSLYPPNTALDVAIGGTGRVTSVTMDGDRVTGGTLDLTGGGDLTIKVGGILHGGMSFNGPGATLTNLRGQLDLAAGAIGTLVPVYDASTVDPRAPDPLVAYQTRYGDGLFVVLGDAAATLTTRGDLALAGTADPGRLPVQNTTPFLYTAADGTLILYEYGGNSWFSLWRPTTSIDLFSAGGNLMPMFAYQQPLTGTAYNWDPTYAPPTFRAVAANGDIHFPANVTSYTGGVGFELAPSPVGQLELLARGSIYANGFAVSISGARANANSIANPFKPAFYAADASLQAIVDPITGKPITNVTPALLPSAFANLSPFTFFPDTPIADTPTATLHAADPEPVRFYAADGDIIGLNTGSIAKLDPNNPFSRDIYIAAKPVRILAGRDIIGAVDDISSGSLILHNHETDVSVISAGRDIYYAKYNIAGPGQLDITAGRNVYQADKGRLVSIGMLPEVDPLAAVNRSGGAGITVTAGVGASGPNYSGFAERYFDPANLADPARPLADQPGKVAKTYEDDLFAWLTKRFSPEHPYVANGKQYVFTGTKEEALAFFLTLPVEQQGIFVRQVYYAELDISGKEYNDQDSRRAGSYVRGREAIATLFPGNDAAGRPIAYHGDITMFSSLTPNPDNPTGPQILRDAGICTELGGAIQTLTPGGRTLVGVEGIAPGPNAGLITMGADSAIQMYSKGSVLLGLSRVMTTYGGDILIWSAEGDINAGRGSKTTQIFTPPLRGYDRYGNVTISPPMPSSGAGIAAIKSLPDVPPSDVNLVAPEGTIDAGEAGIRANNVNLAALQIINAGNIQAQGTVTGVPVIEAPNVSNALAANSTAGAAAQQAAVPRQGPADAQPSVIIVEFIGFGGAQDEGDQPPDERRRPGRQSGQYDPNGMLRVLGNGPGAAEQAGELTTEERTKLTKQMATSLSRN